MNWRETGPPPSRASWKSMPAVLTIEMSPTESVISNKGSESVTEADIRTEDEQPQSSGREDIDPQVVTGFRDRWRQALGILVCLEVGIFLFAAPWSPLWSGNLLLDYYPAMRPLWVNPFVRGAISGVGLLNLWFAFRGVWEFRDCDEAAESQ